MKNKFHILILITITCAYSKAQDSTNYYQEAFEIIDSMLTGKTETSFKKAVFATENAYLDRQMSFLKFDREIKRLVNIIQIVRNSNPIIYNESDKENIEINASIFKVMTDTIPILSDTSNLMIHYPLLYDFDDMWGQIDWGSMFVSKLLVTQKGNCHSLPYLYKILAEELGAHSYLAFAPNHIYIKLHCKKTGWYNTELTSATFPVDAWIMASGYVHLDAIRNGLYMDTLSLNQSVAYCLLDLAQGYQRKFGKSNPEFVLKCCETVLKYNPVNVNAMLTKAEAQKRFIEAKMKTKNVKNPKDLFADNSIKAMYSDMEQTYVLLHQLGYRRMPEEMYMQWMGLLKSEPEKYIFKTITEKSGTTHGKTYEMTGAYFESDKFKEMNDYAKGRLGENTNPDREKYSTMSNNCGDFATDVLKQDESIKTPLVEDPRPTGLIEQYKTTSDYNVTYTSGQGTTVNYPENTVQYNQSTNQTATSQNWWQKLWYGSGE